MFENVISSAFGFMAQAASGGVTPEALPAAAQSQASNPVASVLFGITCFIYGVVCILLIGLVMFQTSKAEGLAGIMGGSAQNMFKGKETKDTREEVFKKWTNWLSIAFVLLSVGLSYWFIKL